MAGRLKNLHDVVSRKPFEQSGVYDFNDGGGHKASTGHRCYHSHPALKLPGTDYVIYGGSCISPAVTDADIYIGFDYGMKITPRSLPWTPGVEFLYEIQDMAAPKDAATFKQLVDWVADQLRDGKKIHCGCIGGHGRTGTFFAALVSVFGEPDAINYVRKNYCQKAVESSSQITFLAKHYGVKEAKGSKSGGHSNHGKQSVHEWADSLGKTKDTLSFGPDISRFPPLPKSNSIWDR